MKPRDRFVLFYVYSDGNTVPWIIRNPPSNLRALLKRWNKLDDKYMHEDGEIPVDWKPVNEWLKDRGVDIFEGRIVYLDDCGRI